MILEGGVAFSHADEADFESELDARSIKNRFRTADQQGELHSPLRAATRSSEVS